MRKVKNAFPTVIFLFIWVLIGSCNKEKKYTRFLEGDWDCVLVKMQDAEGFTFFYTPAIGSNPSLGKLTIDAQQNVTCSVFSEFQTFASVVKDSLVLNGIVAFNLKENEINWIQANDTLKNRIFILNKTDLEFEYYNTSLNRRVRYVFHKSN